MASSYLNTTVSELLSKKQPAVKQIPSHLTKSMFTDNLPDIDIEGIVVGCEVELEDCKIHEDVDSFTHYISKYCTVTQDGKNIIGIFYTLWKIIIDHSLRGEESRELVFSSPLTMNTARIAIAAFDYINEMVKEATNTTPSTSPRTSVHVHINAVGLTVKQYVCVVLMYALFEEALFSYCGYSRRHNNYAVPLLSCIETQEQVGKIMSTFLKHDSIPQNAASNVLVHSLSGVNKYSALNFGINKHTPSLTFEFRHLPGTISAETIWEWMLLCACIVKAGKDIATTHTFDELEEHIHSMDITRLVNDVFPNKTLRDAIWPHMNNTGLDKGKDAFDFMKNYPVLETLQFMM